MTDKFDLRRIGLVMLVLCTALAMTVLPAAADYTADQSLYTYEQGSITGDMNYTIGDSHYSSKMWSNGSDVYTVNIPENSIPSLGSTVVLGRLYVYWTWSYNATDGVNQGIDDPDMSVTFNGYSLPLDEGYTDRKGSGSYNYPSGLYCYDVTSNISTGYNTYVVNVSNKYGSNVNQSFNIQAVGLLTAYNSISGSTKDYWINEGCDVTYNYWKNTTNAWGYDITPDDCVSLTNFTGVNTTNLDSATLITCVPSGDSIYNRLYVNYFFNYPAWQGIKYWDGLWNATGNTDFSWAETDITNNLIAEEPIYNGETVYVGFQNGLYTMIPNPNTKYNQERQMQAANAFLLLEYN